MSQLANVVDPDAVAWDTEADLVAVGSGIGGLAAAITAQRTGSTAVVLEKTDLIGGVTAYSFGELWAAGTDLQREAGIEDTLEEGLRYIESLGMGHVDRGLARNYCVHAPVVLRWFSEQIGVRWRLVSNFADYYYPANPYAAATGRVIEVEPFPATRLGDWRERVRSSPHMPNGMTHDDMFGQGGAANAANWDFTVMGERLAADERTLGPGLAGWFALGAIESGADIRTGAAVRELLTDGTRVVGVRAEQDLLVRARSGVVLATSAYDWNDEMRRGFDGVVGGQTTAPPGVTGDGIAMAGELGAKLARIPMVDLIGYHIPGEEQDDVPFWRLGTVELGLPHTIAVNSRGKRFADEAFYRSLGAAIKIVDAGTQRELNLPCYAILDDQARSKYPYGPISPGEELPDGLAVQADTLEELATKLGIDPAGLVAEVERFNGFARSGVDEDFGRGEKHWSNRFNGDVRQQPNPNMGTVERPPFWGIPQSPVAIGLASTGLAGDRHGRVLDQHGEAIPGLYAAGNAMALTDLGAGYQSGQANTRGMIYGHLAARHAAGTPSTLLDD